MPDVQGLPEPLSTRLHEKRRGEEEGRQLFWVKRSRLGDQKFWAFLSVLSPSSAGLGQVTGLAEGQFLHRCHGDNKNQPASWS